MLPIEDKLQALHAWSDNAAENVLSIYCDINPAKPENSGKAWLRRVKNGLKELPEIRDTNGKRDTPLYDQVLELLELERPEARTLALFAHRNEHGRLYSERLDLQVELPVVDLRNGRVEATYGSPNLLPLWFAVDEYERVGVLILTAGSWRFFECFLGEIRETNDLFATIDDTDWKSLKEASNKVNQAWSWRAARPGGRFDKLSPEDRAAAKVSTWLQKLYKRLGDLLEKAVQSLGIERLVLIGESWQISHFEGYLNRGTQARVAARLAYKPELAEASPAAVLRYVEPALEEAERKKELELIAKIRSQPGLWGVDAVLDALQLGRVKVWVLPWSLEHQVWRCNDGFVAATRETAEIICPMPQQVELREYALSLASEFGAEIEFVRGEAEEILLREMEGMAAVVRW
jgi:hypothetical protein